MSADGCATSSSSAGPTSSSARSATVVTPPAHDDGWRTLFDDRTLNGWVQRGGRAEYRVEDGAIVGATRPNQANSFLCTTEVFADFELDLEFKVDPRLNSGIQVRSEARLEGGAEVVFGYQIEIDPSDRAWTGGLYDESRRGWLADLTSNPDARAAFVQNEWNHFRIECRGDLIRTWINGVPGVEVRDGMTRSGFIALQVHGVGARADELTVRWRNIRLKPSGKPP